MAPQIRNPKLTLTRQGANVRIDVTYNAVFSRLDRHLAGVGLAFQERIIVIGIDPPGATTGTPLTAFIPEFLSVSDGDDPQIIPRSRSTTVPRALLDEDQNPVVHPDALPDEIRCKIRIDAIGIPPAITEAFTNEQVLSSPS